MRVLAIGEMLWDVFPEQELLGGAALNFCANLERLGDTARLITAVGNDARGHRAVEQMSALGMNSQFVQTTVDAPTGAAVVSHETSGEPLFAVLRPAAYDRITVDDALLAGIAEYDPHWIYFGTLFHTVERNEAFTRAVLQAAPSARVFYDMNLRPNQWDFPLVQRLCSLASILKLNEHEVRILAIQRGINPDDPLESFTQCVSEEFDVPTICITLGANGCFVYDRGLSVHVPGHTIRAEDTVGAGDAFSAAFLHGYDRGFPILETAQLANAVGAVVASRSGATPPWTVNELHAMSASLVTPRGCS